MAASSTQAAQSGPINTAPPADTGSTGVDMGLAVGIPVAVVVFLLLVGLAVFLVWRWKYRRKYNMNDTFTPKKNLTKSMHNEEGLSTPANQDTERNGSISRPEILVRTPSRQAELCVVRHLFEAKESNHLTIQTGRIVEVIEKNPNGWWRGMIDDKVGWFPASYVRKIDASEKVKYEQSSPEKRSASPGRLVNNKFHSANKKKAPEIPTVHKNGEHHNDVKKKQDVSIRSDKEQLIISGNESMLDNGDVSMKVESPGSKSVQGIEQVENEEQLKGFINEIFTVEDEISIREDDENEIKPVDIIEEVKQQHIVVPQVHQTINSSKPALANKSALSTESYEMKESFGPESTQEILDDVDDEVIQLTADSQSPASRGAVVGVTSSGIWNVTQSEPKMAGERSNGTEAKSLKSKSLVNSSEEVVANDDLDMSQRDLAHEDKNKFVPSPGTSPILAYPGDKRHSTPKRKVDNVEHTYVAMFPFKAVHREQMSLAPNDVVVSKGEVVNGWLKGSNKSTKKDGWFPRSYVREAHENKKDFDKSVTVSESSDTDFRDHSFDEDVTGMAYRVMHPYTATQDGDLALSEGELVVVFEMLENGWWRGVHEGKEGWFPGAYVEAIPQTPVTPKFGSHPFSTLPRNFKQGDDNAALTTSSMPALSVNKRSTLPAGIMGSSPSLTEAEDTPVKDKNSRGSSKPGVPKRFVIPKLMKLPKSKSSKKVKEKPARPVPPAPTISHPIAPPRKSSQQKYKRPSLSRPNEPPPPRPPSEVDNESNDSNSPQWKEKMLAINRDSLEEPNSRESSISSSNASSVIENIEKDNTEPFSEEVFLQSNVSPVQAPKHVEDIKKLGQTVVSFSKSGMPSSYEGEIDSNVDQVSDKKLHTQFFGGDKDVAIDEIQDKNDGDKITHLNIVNRDRLTDNLSGTINVRPLNQNARIGDLNNESPDEQFTIKQVDKSNEVVTSSKKNKNKRFGLRLNTKNLVKSPEKHSPKTDFQSDAEINQNNSEVKKLGSSSQNIEFETDSSQRDHPVSHKTTRKKPPAQPKPTTPVSRRLEFKQEKLEELVLNEIIDTHNNSRHNKEYYDEFESNTDKTPKTNNGEELFTDKTSSNLKHIEAETQDQMEIDFEENQTKNALSTKRIPSPYDSVEPALNKIEPIVHNDFDIPPSLKLEPIVDNIFDKRNQYKMSMEKANEDSLLAEIMNSFEDLRNNIDSEKTKTSCNEVDDEVDVNLEHDRQSPLMSSLVEKSPSDMSHNQDVHYIVSPHQVKVETSQPEVKSTERPKIITEPPFLPLNSMGTPREVKTPIVSSPKDDYTISMLSNKSSLSSIELDSELSFKSQLDSINIGEDEYTNYTPAKPDFTNDDIEELPPLPEVPPPLDSPALSRSSTSLTPNVSVNSSNGTSMISQNPSEDTTPNVSVDNFDAVATPNVSLNHKPPYELLMTSPYIVIKTPHSKKDVTMPTEEVSFLTKSVVVKDETSVEHDVTGKSMETTGGGLRSQLSSLFDKLMPDAFRNDDDDIEEGKIDKIQGEIADHPVHKIDLVSSPYMKNELKSDNDYSNNRSEREEYSMDENSTRNTDRSAISANTAFTVESGIVSPTKPQVPYTNNKQPAKPPRKIKSSSSDEERNGPVSEQNVDEMKQNLDMSVVSGNPSPKWKLPPLRPAPTSSYNMQNEIKDRSPPILTSPLSFENRQHKSSDSSSDSTNTSSSQLSSPLEMGSPKSITPPPPLQRVNEDGINDAHADESLEVDITHNRNEMPTITPPSALIQPKKLSTPDTFKFFTPTKFVAKEYKNSTPSPQNMSRDVPSPFGSSVDNELQFEVRQNSNMYNVKVVNSVNNNSIYDNDPNGNMSDQSNSSSVFNMSNARIIGFDTPKPFHKPGVIRKVFAPKSNVSKSKTHHLEEGISEF